MKYSQSEMEARLAEIRRSYLVSLRDKTEAIRQYRSTLCQQWNDATCHDLFMILHSLAGSAETFGFAEVSAAARVLVEQLRPLADAAATMKSAAAVVDMNAEFERLLSELEQALSA